MYFNTNLVGTLRQGARPGDAAGPARDGRSPPRGDQPHGALSEGRLAERLGRITAGAGAKRRRLDGRPHRSAREVPPNRRPLEIDGEILRFAALQLGADAEKIHAYARRQQTVSEHQQRIGEYLRLRTAGERSASAGPITPSSRSILAGKLCFHPTTKEPLRIPVALPDC